MHTNGFGRDADAVTGRNGPAQRILKRLCEFGVVVFPGIAIGLVDILHESVIEFTKGSHSWSNVLNFLRKQQQSCGDGVLDTIIAIE